MWMAWLRRRLPRRDSRWIFRPPEATSMGAVPLSAAKWSRPGKRDTWRTSPMTAAAMTGPTPNSLVRLVPAARTAVAAFFLVSRIWASTPRRSAVSSAASSQRASSTASARDRIQQMRGLACGDLPGDAAGEQLAQHLVQPAGYLGARPAQVLIPLGPDLEDRGVIVTPGLPDPGGAQRDGRHRE